MNIESYIWIYYQFPKSQTFVLTNSLFVILTIQLVDKSLKFLLYKLHNCHFYIRLCKNHFIMKHLINILLLDKVLRYNTFPDDDNVFSCIVSTGQFFVD